MASNRMSEAAHQDNRLGRYLKARRAKLDPSAFGFPMRRRRTPGLRREEVAQRANISPAWYTWLEQGRGGAPSPEVLERIARALLLTEAEREHLFLLGLGRPPELRRRLGDAIEPRLQRVLDSLEPNAAMIRTIAWDVVAWNRAVAVLLTDYDAVAPGERNILRQLFARPDLRDVHQDWQSVARFVVGAFRADAARAGFSEPVERLVDELCATSPEFKSLWHDNDISEMGGGLKRIRHPSLGLVEFELSSFTVDGRPDLRLLVYSPVKEADLERVRALIEQRSAGPA